MSDAGLTINLAGASADDVPMLRDGEVLDLPPNAALQADGSVLLTFDRPVTFAYRTAAGETARSETYPSLLLQRLTGADMRKVMSANSARSTQVALAASARLSHAKFALIADRMDAADLIAAQNVIAELLQMGDDLPRQAQEQDDGCIVLPLRAPLADGDGETHAELTFHRLTGGDLTAIAAAKEPLLTAIARATRMAPKAIASLFNDMDGADVVAAQRVVNFLSGTGRKTGR